MFRAVLRRLEEALGPSVQQHTPTHSLPSAAQTQTSKPAQTLQNTHNASPAPPARPALLCQVAAPSSALEEKMTCEDGKCSTASSAEENSGTRQLAPWHAITSDPLITENPCSNGNNLSSPARLEQDLSKQAHGGVRTSDRQRGRQPATRRQ
ncbi:unnamed protein product [Pleuronectes platessa]|uniref:Uncharacterized protein n=1 Tax=Pleuronectes platessa TaxID=8262 RepID=A0A9N7UUV2_PLEPL|nr:unnamed protein product [Pleuronectes platessa]